MEQAVHSFGDFIRAEFLPYDTSIISDTLSEPPSGGAVNLGRRCRFFLSVEDVQAPPAPITINLPLGKSPANGGTEANAARGGDGASSIAQRYLCTLVGGNP